MKHRLEIDGALLASHLANDWGAMRVNDVTAEAVRCHGGPLHGDVVVNPCYLHEGEGALRRGDDLLELQGITLRTPMSALTSAVRTSRGPNASGWWAGWPARGRAPRSSA